MEKTIIQKKICVISSLISWLYGFTILLIFDVIYTCKFSFPNDPIFQHPSSESVIRGIILVFVYFSLMLILHYKAKSRGMRCYKKFIFMNVIAFILGFFLFFIIGLPFVSPHITNQL